MTLLSLDLYSIVTFILILQVISKGLANFERLAIISEYSSAGVFNWQVMRERYAGLPRLVTLFLDRLFAFQLTVKLLLFTQPFALLGAALLPRSHFYFLLLTFFSFIAQIFLMVRCAGLGCDGADNMSSVVIGAFFFGSLSSVPTQGLYISIIFIALQSTLSYLVSGIAKLVSPIWRSGQALPLIFNTSTYGSEAAVRCLKSQKALSLLLSWFTIAWESCFPLSLFGSSAVTYSFVTIAFLFHVSCALFMGLNTFLFSFSSALLAVLYLSNNLHLMLPNMFIT